MQHQSKLQVLALLLLTACSGQADSDGRSTRSLSQPGLSLQEAPAFEVHAAGWRPDKGQEFRESIHWQEAGKSRTAWMDSGLLLEFGTSQAEPSTLIGLVPGIQIERELGPAARLWRLPANCEASGLLPLLEGQTRFSPVLRLAPAPSGPIQGLPGGVLVTFDTDIDLGPACNTLEEHGFTIMSQWSLPSPLVHVASPSGLACLTQAQEIAELPGVAQAIPNWWLERSSR